MIFKIFAVSLVLSLACQTNALVTSGKCITAPSLANFEPTKYLGKWYEIQRLPAVFEAGLKCVTAQYGLINATTVSVKNNGIKTSDGSVSIIDGYAVIDNSNEPNKLSVYFPFNLGGVISFSQASPYNVWQSDYETYSLVYSCTPLISGILKSETAWVLSRTPTLDANKVEELKNILKGQGVNTDPFEVVDQASCQ